jgi:hypothetical protein
MALDSAKRLRVGNYPDAIIEGNIAHFYFNQAGTGTNRPTQLTLVDKSPVATSVTGASSHVPSTLDSDVRSQELE